MEGKILLESGEYMLQEDGNKILLELFYAIGSILGLDKSTGIHSGLKKVLIGRKKNTTVLVGKRL